MGLEQLTTRILEWRKSPLKFVREAIGAEPTEQQVEGLTALGELISQKLKKKTQKLGISIMSGQGTGKDAYVAWAILFFLTCFPRPKIPCTAPVSDQLRNILWAEVSKWLNRRVEGKFVCLVRDLFTIQSDKIFLTELKGKEWFAVARTASPTGSAEEQAETLAGFHEDYMMTICDEASGIQDSVFKPIEGGTTGLCNIVIIIFNPTRRSGYAFESHYGKEEIRERWIRLHWDGEKSPLLTKEHIRAIEDKYGRDSDFFRIRINGLPPTTDTHSLIPWDWAYNSIKREIVPDDSTILGVDCAGYGEDKAVIIARHGSVIDKPEVYKQLSTSELAGWVLQATTTYPDCVVCIDAIGLGAGVYDQVRMYYPKTHAVNVARVSYRPEKFMRLRDELWWKTRERFEAGTISIADDDELVAELTGPRYETDSKGRIKVEGKKEMRARGMRSPNKADALCMTYYINEAKYRIGKKYYTPRAERREVAGTHSWMGV